MQATSLARLLGSVVAVATAAGQTITPVVLEGDDVPGIGLVTVINKVAVNDDGGWLVEASTDHPVASRNGVYLEGFQDAGFGVKLREGDALPSPAGATVSSVDGFSYNVRGNAGWNFFLNNTPGGTSDDSGVFFNATLLVQESGISTAPGFTPPTPYLGFFDVSINDSDQVLVVGTVDDPGIASGVDRALVRIDNPAGVFTETVIAKEGDEPLAGRPFGDFGTAAHQSGIAPNGDVAYFADLAGDSASDGSIWLNQQLIAQEAGPSPLAGRSYQLLSSRTLACGGDSATTRLAFRANLDGDSADDEVIVLVETDPPTVGVAHREGDSPAAIAPFQITAFGTSATPLAIAGDRVAWYGEWNDPDVSRNAGLFIGDELIVQKGVTQIDGLTVTALATGAHGFHASPGGDWLIFEATLAGGIEGAFLHAAPSCCLGDAVTCSNIDINDLLAVLGDFGNPGPDASGDADCDGDTDLEDLLQVLVHFGETCPA